MNWTQAPFPVAPWDPPGLPPRSLSDRCARHTHCAYRDDDPTRCPRCHASLEKCRGLTAPVEDDELVPTLAVGDRVRIERDENRYPSRGTWPQFRGKSGTVVEINHDKRPRLTEYGVLFGTPRADGRGGQREVVTWFKVHELRALAAESPAEPTSASRQGDWTLAQ